MLTVNLRDSKCTNEEQKNSKTSTGFSSFIFSETQTGDESKISSKQSSKTLKCPDSPNKQSKISKKISSTLLGKCLENSFDNIKVCEKVSSFYKYFKLKNILKYIYILAI
jgi:hypothetical protein